MDIKTMLEEIAPEVDESVAHDQIMSMVRRRRRGLWVARVAAAAAVVAGFVAVAAVTGGEDPVAPADGSSTTAPLEPRTTVTSVGPTVSAAPPPPSSTGAPTTTTSPTTTAAPTTTAPPSTTIPIVEPTIVTYDELPDVSSIVRESTAQGPIVPMGNDDGDGSGCTPGVTDSLPDGLWYVRIVSGSVRDGIAHIEFDLVCRYSEDERQAIYTPDEVIYDTSVRNDSPLLRTMPLSGDAKAIVAGGEPTWELWADAPSFATVRAEFVLSAWLKVVDGEIVEVFRQFEA